MISAPSGTNFRYKVSAVSLSSIVQARCATSDADGARSRRDLSYSDEASYITRLRPLTKAPTTSRGEARLKIREKEVSRRCQFEAGPTSRPNGCRSGGVGAAETVSRPVVGP